MSLKICFYVQQVLIMYMMHHMLTWGNPGENREYKKNLYHHTCYVCVILAVRPAFLVSQCNGMESHQSTAFEIVPWQTWQYLSKPFFIIRFHNDMNGNNAWLTNIYSLDKNIDGSRNIREVSAAIFTHIIIKKINICKQLARPHGPRTVSSQWAVLQMMPLLCGLFPSHVTIITYSADGVIVYQISGHKSMERKLLRAKYHCKPRKHARKNPHIRPKFLAKITKVGALIDGTIHKLSSYLFSCIVTIVIR